MGKIKKWIHNNDNEIRLLLIYGGFIVLVIFCFWLKYKIAVSNMPFWVKYIFLK